MIERCSVCKRAVQLFDDGLCFQCSPQFRHSHTKPEPKPQRVAPSMRPPAPAAPVTPKPAPGLFGSVIKEPETQPTRSAAFEAFRNLAVLAAVIALTLGGIAYFVHRDDMKDQEA